MGTEYIKDKKENIIVSETTHKEHVMYKKNQTYIHSPCRIHKQKHNRFPRTQWTIRPQSWQNPVEHVTTKRGLSPGQPRLPNPVKFPWAIPVNISQLILWENLINGFFPWNHGWGRICSILGSFLSWRNKTNKRSTV